MNVAVVDVAATATDDATGNTDALLDESVTVLPPAGAASLKVTVHVVVVPEVTLAGLHTSEVASGPLGTTVTAAVVLPPSVAVKVTAWGVATEPAVAVNVAEVAAAGTAIEPGTGSAAGLVEASATVPPPAGAG